MKQVPSVTHAALAAGRMKYSNYSRPPHIMTGLQKLTCNHRREKKKRKLKNCVFYCCCFGGGQELTKQSVILKESEYITKYVLKNPKEGSRERRREGGRERREGGRGGWKEERRDRRREGGRKGGKCYPKLPQLGNLPTLDTGSCCSHILLHINKGHYFGEGGVGAAHSDPVNQGC